VNTAVFWDLLGDAEKTSETSVRMFIYWC